MGYPVLVFSGGSRDKEFLIEHGANNLIEHPLDILNVKFNQ